MFIDQWRILQDVLDIFYCFTLLFAVGISTFYETRVEDTLRVFYN